MRKLTAEQIAKIRRCYRRWEGTLPPCEIPYFHPYNPCLPEEFAGRLECVTCGLKQRLELTSGTLDV